MRALLLAAIATVGMGCVGSLDTTGSGGPGDDTTNPPPPPGPDPTPTGQPSDTARTMFNANVYPIISSKCIGCHKVGATINALAPPFVDGTAPSVDPYKAWQTVTGQPSVVGTFAPTANILNIPTTVAQHSGLSYATTEQNFIKNWLAAETAWRTGGTTGQTDLLQLWTGCMTKANFDAAAMADSWANQVNTTEGTCVKCHVNGFQGMIATPQSQYMFDTLTTNRNYLITYFAVDTTVTPNKVVINTLSFKAVCNGQAPFSSHPQFNGTNNAGITALTTFYNSTQAMMTAGTCPSKGTLTN